MFKTLQEDLDNRLFTDMELTFVDSSCSRSITCHRNILASVPYFYKLFTTFADSLAQKEFVVHVDDAAIAHDFVLSLYQLESRADYPSWLHTLKTMKLRDFFCLDLDASQLYNLVVPDEGFELLIEVVKLFKLADVIKDRKLTRKLRKILPAELIATNFTQELAYFISQKNKYFLIANGDDVELRDLERKKVIKTFSRPLGHNNYVVSLLLVDNQHFLSGSFDKTIKLWNVESGFIRTFAGPHSHANYVTLLVLVDDQHFLSASYDGVIKLWNIESGEHVRTFAGPNGHTRRVTSLILLSDNKHFLSATDETIKLWNLESGFMHTFADPLGRVGSLLQVDNKHFLSASDDNTIKLWNIESGFMRAFAGPHGHTDWVISLLLVDNQHFLSASWDGTIKLWNIESGFMRTFAGPHGHTNHVYLVVLVDNQHFLSASTDRTIKLWNIESGEHVRTFAGPHGHTNRITSLVLVDNQHFFFASDNETIKLWDIESGECVRTTKVRKTSCLTIL